MKTYVISLHERSDRREKFFLPFDFEFLLQDRVTGVVGIDWSLANLGCMLGHRQAIQLAKDHELDEVLVLEDDAELVGEMPTGLHSDFPTFLGGDIQGKNVVGSHAVYYPSSVFDELLKLLPSKEQLQNSEHPCMLDPYDLWLSNFKVGYINIFKSFDDDNGNIPHGGKVTTTKKQQLATI